MLKMRPIGPLRVNIKVEAWQSIAGGSIERITKLVIQIRTNTALPSVKHLIAEANAGPLVPADERATVEASEWVLRMSDIISIGRSGAIAAVVLVID